jgi:hypothetical protein
MAAPDFFTGSNGHEPEVESFKFAAELPPLNSDAR